MENENLNVNDPQSTDDHNEFFEELNDVPRHGNKRSKRKVITRTAATISFASHVLTAALTVYILYLSFKSYSLFSWHPACAAVGFLVLMAQSIMVMSQDNILAGALNRKQRVRAHWILLVLAAGLILASFVAIVVNKDHRGKRHFVSIHAIVGLVSIVLVALASFGGVAALYSSRLKSFVKTGTLKLAHIVVGIVTFVVGIASFVTSLYTNFFRREAGTSSQIICLIFLTLAGVLALASSGKSAYGRIRSLFRR